MSAQGKPRRANGLSDLNPLIRGAMTAASPDWRNVFAEYLLYSLLARKSEGWSDSQASRVQLREALTAANGQDDPLEAAGANILEYGRRSATLDTAFDEDQ